MFFNLLFNLLFTAFYYILIATLSQESLKMQYTLDQLHAHQRDQLTALIEHAGSASHLAKMLNIHVSVVQGWEQRGRISKQGAQLVDIHPALSERFSAMGLRPDIDQ